MKIIEALSILQHLLFLIISNAVVFLDCNFSIINFQFACNVVRVLYLAPALILC